MFQNDIRKMYRSSNIVFVWLRETFSLEDKLFMVVAMERAGKNFGDQNFKFHMRKKENYIAMLPQVVSAVCSVHANMIWKFQPLQIQPSKNSAVNSAVVQPFLVFPTAEDAWVFHFFQPSAAAIAVFSAVCQPPNSRSRAIFSRQPAAEFCSAVDQAQSAVSRE
jgi:hypothetical protein